MTRKEFVKRIANSKVDFLQDFLDFRKKEKVAFCVIGGLAVNAYAEPVVSLDLDIVIAIRKLDKLLSSLPKRYSVKQFPNSVNISDPGSDLRIQIQKDGRYQLFISRAVKKNVLGYKMPVATIKDVLQGKIWSATDKTRRPSKRQKDLADILRLIEMKPGLAAGIPGALRKSLNL